MLLKPLKPRLKDEPGVGGGAFQADGTVYAKPSERPPPLLSPALRSLEPVPLAVSSAETLDVSAFPWNLLLEGGNQVRPIKLCDINDALPRPLGGGVAGSLGCC